MTKHEINTCPHCQKNFECKAGDILNCQCETVELTQAQRDYIFSRYDECLCASCLVTLRTEFNLGNFKLQMQQLVAGK